MATFTTNDSSAPGTQQEYLEPIKTEYPSGVNQQLLQTNDPITHPYAPTSGKCDEAPDSNEQWFVTVPAQVSGTALADFRVQCPFPARFICLVSRDAAVAGDSLFLHLTKLGKKYPSTSIAPDGTENWFPIHFVNSAGSQSYNLGIGNWIKFCKPISAFFLDIGMEHGGTGPGAMTFVGSEDTDFIRLFS